MASLPSTARASFKGAYTIESVFAVLSALLQARCVLAGGYDPAKTSIVDGQAYTVLSASQAATLFGYGSQLHRMYIYHYKGSGGAVPTICIPLPAASGGVAEIRTLTFTTNATSSGTYYLRCGSYLSEELISVAVASGATITEIATAVAAAINAVPNLPFSATSSAGVVTLTAKTADITSADLSITLNQRPDEAEDLPGGTTYAFAVTTDGAGKSSLAMLFSYIAAETTPWITSIVHPYVDAADLDTALAAMGNPNDQSGQYNPRDYRPASVYSCDTTAGEAGLTAALALSEDRKEDVANIRLEAPSYPELGYEIAAYVAAVISANSMTRSSSGYTRLSLTALYGPLTPTDDWTTYKSGGKSYDNRDLAVKGGLTPIIYKDGVAKPGDVTGFWRPDDNQNAPFKYQVNRWKIWNFQNIQNVNLNGDTLADRPIVNSASAVRQSEKPIDADIIKATVDLVTGKAAEYGWIYDGAFTVRNTLVEISGDNPDRFDITIPIIVSGNNRIAIAGIEIDRNIDVVDLTLQASA